MPVPKNRSIGKSIYPKDYPEQPTTETYCKWFIGFMRQRYNPANFPKILNDDSNSTFKKRMDQLRERIFNRTIKRSVSRAKERICKRSS